MRGSKPKARTTSHRASHWSTTWTCVVFMLLHVDIAASPGLKRGTVIKHLVWPDNSIKRDLTVLNVTSNNVILRVDGKVENMEKNLFMSLYLSTPGKVTSGRIQKEAREIGVSKQEISGPELLKAGSIIPKLVWTDGKMREKVEILNIKNGYYVLRVDGKTNVIDREKFLQVILNTRRLLPPSTEEPSGPFETKNPVGAKIPAESTFAGETSKKTNTPAPSGNKSKPVPNGITLGPPPSPTQKPPHTKRPIHFDFIFVGDSTSPSLPTDTAAKP